jgi:hypothetical protein
MRAPASVCTRRRVHARVTAHTSVCVPIACSFCAHACVALTAPLGRLNQSHNAAVNFANRNASKPTPTSALVQGYAGAVGTAVSIAVGLEVVLRNAQSLKPAVRVALQRFLPYPAVAVANICNVYLMRRQELSQGIEVTDPSGEVRAAPTRVRAAQRSLTLRLPLWRSTCSARARLPRAARCARRRSRA